MLMSGRTFAIGDVHGETAHLVRVLAQLPELTSGDTLVFLGDYLDRGPDSRGVVELLMRLPERMSAKVVCLRGNHEDAWLRVRREGWDAFAFPAAHGCLAAVRSFLGGAVPVAGEQPRDSDRALMASGSFFPPEVAAWMESLPYWYEDEHGIYVHAGLPRAEVGFAHPSEVTPYVLAWIRTDEFVRNYQGKNIFFGHTPTGFLPQEISLHTPDDPTDMFETEDCFGLDTGCGVGGFLTAIELPSMKVYESRER
jgi:serine/threonine protein phosphatase 1